MIIRFPLWWLPEIIIFVDISVLLCKGLQLSNMWLCINTRSDDCTGHLSACFAPPLLHSIQLSEKEKIMLIQFKINYVHQMQNFFKAAVSTNIRRRNSLKLSSAWWRRDDVSSVRFLNRPANNQKNQTVTKTRKAWHEIDPDSFRSMLCGKFDRLRACNIFRLL